MKIPALILFICCCVNSTYAQQAIAGEPYAQNIYNPYTKSFNLSHNYSGKWDFDGDGKNDSLFFIGNGGAHAYFYPKIILSANGSEKNYPAVQLDMPYFKNRAVLNEYGKTPAVQLVIDDLDKDGITDIYFNFDHPSASVPKEWKRKGIHTKYVVVSFASGILKCSDY